MSKGRDTVGDMREQFFVLGVVRLLSFRNAVCDLRETVGCKPIIFDELVGCMSCDASRKLPSVNITGFAQFHHNTINSCDRTFLELDSL